MPKTIIWDFDGTIINSFEIYQTLISRALEARGLPVPSTESFRQHNHGTMHESISGLTGITDDVLVQQIHDDFLRDEDDSYSDIAKLLYADAVALLKRAHVKGIKQILVTNRLHDGRKLGSPKYIVENSVLSDMISHVVAGDEVVFRKPDKRVLEVLEGHDLNSDVLVIGDQFVDGQFAINIGAQSVLVKRHGKIEHLEKLGDGWESHVSIVDSLDEVEL